MKLKRNDAAKIEELLANFPVVAILGPRQCGKTTLARSLRPNWRYMDLERPSDFAELSDPENFFANYSKEVIFDEAQRSPLLFQVLRGVIDAKREQVGRFILTGSSSPELLKNISESLAGRIAIVELSTLKVNEYAQEELSPIYQILQTKIKPNDLTIFSDLKCLQKEAVHRLWLWGGYPEAALKSTAKDIEVWYGSYEKSYIYRDVAELFPRLNKLAYQRFVRILGHLSGKILNKAQLARDIEVSESSIREYLEIVEGTFLWRQLPSFETKKIKSIVKMPKGHFRDSGLLHYVFKIQDKDALLSHPMVGNSFESFVIEEIIKGFSAINSANIDYYYFRTRNGAEIDLIIDSSFGLIPIEIKYGVYTPVQKLRSLTDFVSVHSRPFGIVVNQADRISWLSPSLLQIPIGYW